MDIKLTHIAQLIIKAKHAFV